MHDTSAIIAAYRKDKDEQWNKKTAIDLLWKTGMITIEEYLFLHHGENYIPEAPTLISYTQERNRIWKDPWIAYRGVLEEYINAGKCPPPQSQTKFDDLQLRKLCL